jgi:hypothetical protein
LPFLPQDKQHTKPYFTGGTKSISSVKETLKRAEEIGRELFSDAGVDSMENMFYSIEFWIRDEIGHDAKPYRTWWNGITNEWKY